MDRIRRALCCPGRHGPPGPTRPALPLVRVVGGLALHQVQHGAEYGGEVGEGDDRAGGEAEVEARGRLCRCGLDEEETDHRARDGERDGDGRGGGQSFEHSGVV